MSANVTIRLTPDQFDELREMLAEYRRQLVKVADAAMTEGNSRVREEADLRGRDVSRLLKNLE